MTTLGVILSTMSMAVALLELWFRSDFAGRRMAAICAVVAWATMGFVALDESRRCDNLLRELGESATLRQTQVAGGVGTPQWTYRSPAGAELEFHREAFESRFAGAGNNRMMENLARRHEERVQAQRAESTKE